MKINKAKLLVGTLAIASVAATVGSISGTVAWFQYSTRATVAYQGAAAHCSESLQVRINATPTAGAKFDNAWHQDLTATMIANYLTDTTAHGGADRKTGVGLTPVSSQYLAANSVAATLYKNPIYQFTDKTKWGTATATEDYVVIPLELRVLDIDGTGSDALENKNIYISDLTLAARADHDTYVKNDHLDLTNALRVGVSAGKDRSNLTPYTTFSKLGTPVNVYGALDLNNDGKNDTGANYEWDTGSELEYGDSTAGTNTASSTSTTKVTSAVKGVADDSTPSSILGVEIGSTGTTGTLAVDLMVYLEGWTELAFNEANTNKYKGDLADLDAIKAVTSPTAGEVYKNNDNGKYYRYDGTGWQLVANGKVWDDVQGVGAEFNMGIRFSTEAHNNAAE